MDSAWYSDGRGVGGACENRNKRKTNVNFEVFGEKRMVEYGGRGRNSSSMWSRERGCNRIVREDVRGKAIA